MIFTPAYFINVQTAIHNEWVHCCPDIDRVVSKLNRYQLCNLSGSFSRKRLSRKPGGFRTSKLGVLSQKPVSAGGRNKADERHRKWAEGSRAQGF